MINKAELEAALQEVATAMTNLQQNWANLQGQHQTLTALIGKFAPGVEEMTQGVTHVVEGVGEVAAGAAEVVTETAVV